MNGDLVIPIPWFPPDYHFPVAWLIAISTANMDVTGCKYNVFERGGLGILLELREPFSHVF